MNGKRRIVIANFPDFIHLGGNDGGKGDTIMPVKSEGDTIKKLLRQAAESRICGAKVQDTGHLSLLI